MIMTDTDVVQSTNFLLCDSWEYNYKMLNDSWYDDYDAQESRTN